MNQLLTFFLIFSLSSGVAASMIEAPSFHLEYSKAWRLINDSDSNIYKLISEKYRVSTTISYKQWNQVQLEEASAEYLEIRYQAELDSLKELKRTSNIEKNIQKLPVGYQIEYHGTDSEGRVFRFWAIVATSKIVNIYMESYDQKKEGLDQIFRELLQGLRL